MWQAIFHGKGVHKVHSTEEMTAGKVRECFN